MRAYGQGVCPSYLRLEFCEANKQDHIELLHIADVAFSSAFGFVRSSREICLYIAQGLEFSCLT